MEVEPDDIESFPAPFVARNVIGTGFTGQVWSATDSKTGTTVAIKKLDRQVYEEAHLQFPPLEVELASRLEHPHIVKVKHVITEPDSSIFLVQEYLSGGDLFACMEQWDCFRSFLLVVACKTC